MGEALIGGLVQSGWDPSEVAVADVSGERRRHLAERFAGLGVHEQAADAVAGAETVLVAVKPGDVPAALAEAAGALEGSALVLSIAAGVRIETLEAHVGDNPVVRVMPNTPALVGEGVAAVAAGTHATDEHLARAESILGSVGIVERLPEESLDAVTGLSGSGPAYVFYLAEALAQGGRAAGLPGEVVDRLVVQTLLGAATLLAESGDRPEDLRAAVTSPGGTTAAAVELLDSREAREAFADAVVEATRRSKELGGGSR